MKEGKNKMSKRNEETKKWRSDENEKKRPYSAGHILIAKSKEPKDLKNEIKLVGNKMQEAKMKKKPCKGVKEPKGKKIIRIRFKKNEQFDDFGKSSNWNTSKISSIIKDNQNDYNKKTVLTQNVNNEDNKLLDEDEVYNNPKLHSKEQDEFEIPDGGNGIYVDSESTYVDTGCWSELKHSTGLGFRNAGQDPISTDHGNGGISNKNNGVSSNLSSGNNEKITSLRYPPRRQGDVEDFGYHNGLQPQSNFYATVFSQ
ncbi:hypothetical protein RhiirA1_437427 [Rhizophagus irregularis]|uniref:Uncharacterized protein n=1 Tax=Rhizophagus irregularis TaxID=588596 RepID=A0A2N0SDM6_9GLOM|nr:hypothetical protein RhiirA1_437427 [Rhizophagus irregularis]